MAKSKVKVKVNVKTKVEAFEPPPEVYGAEPSPEDIEFWKGEKLPGNAMTTYTSMEELEEAGLEAGTKIYCYTLNEVTKLKVNKATVELV
jgi:hypothetical protein